METVFTCISLLGGLSLFLYGMRTMGDALARGSGTTLKRALGKITGSNFSAFMLGLLATCIIQSSTATIVLTVGLVGAGMLSYRQSIGIVVGANVGTTITGQIIRLLDITDSTGFAAFFKPSTLAPLALIIGMTLIMFIKKNNNDVGGSIAVGFGVLFTGLLNMTAAVSPLTESAVFADIITAFADIPVLGFLFGLVVTCIVQSSSAVVGMLQAMCVSGIASTAGDFPGFTFSSVYAIIIGINMGDCIKTFFLCRIGASPDQARVGMFHIVYNVFGAIFNIATVLIARPAGLLDTLWNMSLSSGDLANVHTIFRLSSAVVLFPFLGYIDHLTHRIIPDAPKKAKVSGGVTEKLDEGLFISPSLALSAAKDVIAIMGAKAKENTVRAFSLFSSYEPRTVEAIYADEGELDRLADSVDNYLVKLSAHGVSNESSDDLNYYIQCFPEFERIGDLAVNVMENAGDLFERNLVFSDVAAKEMNVLRDAVLEIIDLTNAAFADPSGEAALRIEPLEEAVDDLVATLKNRHVERLRTGQCKTYAGLVFLDALTNIERIADQCSNLAVYTVSLTNPEAKLSHHDYISALHSGADPVFQSEYRKNHDKYFAALPEKEI